jgi:hypothetical protein
MPEYRDPAHVPGVTDILATASRLAIVQKVVAEMVASGGANTYAAVQRLLAGMLMLSEESDTPNAILMAAALREMQDLIEHAEDRPTR